MKKGHQKKQAPQRMGSHPALTAGESIHLRLCHVCFHLNESSSEIIRCQKCRKYLSVEPIWEYLEERQKRRASENDIESEEEAEFSKRVAPRLAGLSVIW